MDSDSSQPLHAIAAALGVTWKRSRKRLPPSSKAKFVELLFDLRFHILPKEELIIDESLQRSRPDMRLLGVFLARLAIRGSSLGEDLDKNLRAVEQVCTNRWFVPTQDGMGAGAGTEGRRQSSISEFFGRAAAPGPQRASPYSSGA